MGDLSASLSRDWRAVAGFQWDPENDEFVSGNSGLHYNDGANKRFNIAHRFVADDFNQALLSFSLPVGQRWRGVGRWN